MKKPDRFECMAREMKFTKPFLAQNIAVLLRRQFSAIRRVVVKQYPTFGGTHASGYEYAKRNIIAALDAYRKGKP